MLQRLSDINTSPLLIQMVMIYSGLPQVGIRFGRGPLVNRRRRPFAA
jgi:hypothetical protein